MAPASLDHSYVWISEEMDGALQQIPLRHEIRIEDTKEFAFRSIESGRQRTGLESGAINAMNQLNIETALTQFVRARSSDLPSLIGRIVQHLNLQKFPRIIHFAHRTHQPLRHVHLVKDWQLHCHLRELFKVTGWQRGTLPVFQIEINDEIAVDAVSRKADPRAKVTNCPDNMSDASLHGV